MPWGTPKSYKTSIFSSQWATNGLSAQLRWPCGTIVGLPPEEDFEEDDDDNEDEQEPEPKPKAKAKAKAKPKVRASGRASVPLSSGGRTVHTTYYNHPSYQEMPVTRIEFNMEMLHFLWVPPT